MWHLACDALYYTDGYGGALIRGCHSACFGEDVPGAADVLGVSSFAGPRVLGIREGPGKQHYAGTFTSPKHCIFLLVSLRDCTPRTSCTMARK